MPSDRPGRLAGNMGDLDAVVVLNATEPFLDSAYWYLTGCSSGTFEGARAVVLSDGSLHVFVSVLEEEAASAGAGEVHVYGTDRERKEMMAEVLRGAGKVGVNYPCAAYGSVEWLKGVTDAAVSDASAAIAETMAVKDEAEIAEISAACAISSRVASEIPGMLREGVTEAEVASEMDIRMLRYGGSGNAFETIAAFGPASSEPHHRPGSYALRRGDAALFDFGSKHGLYCSDLTRTVFLGEPPDVLRRAYDVVLEAQRAGIARIRAGAPAKDADLAARTVIDASEFKGRFIHSFGHGIGMNVHEPVSLSPKSEQILRAGNVVSAEPGVYLPGIGGIRIEDTVLVTEDGCRILTDYDHSLTVV